MQIKRCDIVWLVPGIDDLKKLGKNVQSISRPYIVISNNMNNKYSPTVQIAAVSKQVGKENYPMHVLIKAKDYDCLDYDSIILLEQVITINKELIQRKAMSLNAEDTKKVNKAVFIQMIDETMNIDNVV